MCTSWTGVWVLQLLLTFDLKVSGHQLDFSVGLLPCDFEHHLCDAGLTVFWGESAPPPDPGIHAPSPVATAIRRVRVCRQDRFFK